MSILFFVNNAETITLAGTMGRDIRECLFTIFMEGYIEYETDYP